VTPSICLTSGAAATPGRRLHLATTVRPNPNSDEFSFNEWEAPAQNVSAPSSFMKYESN